MGRIWELAALAVGIWLLSVFGQSRPEALGLDAPATRFSAARADAVLGRLLADQRPRPAGSPENAAFRGRLLKELAALGVVARAADPDELLPANGAGALFLAPRSPMSSRMCLPGSGKPILLMAHADSVAAGPGAGDDASGVADFAGNHPRAEGARLARWPSRHRAVHRWRREWLAGRGRLSARSAGARAYRRGDQYGIAGQSGPQLSVPDQRGRRQADRSLCAQRTALCGIVALCRDIQDPAQRYRSDAVPGGAGSPATISPLSGMPRTITRRWTAARISIRAACSSMATMRWS